MGEAKRKAEKLSPVEKEALKMTRTLANEGQLIMGGFAAWMLINKINFRIPDPEHAKYADAYFAGAEHLWSSIMATFDPGEEETPADMRRMDLIQKEVDAWREKKWTAYAKGMPTKGNA